MDPDRIRQEVERLSSLNPKEVGKAESTLRRLSPQDVRNLLEWSRVSEQSQSWINGCSGCTAACFGIPAALLAALVVISALFNRPEALVGLSFCAIPLLVAFGASRLIRSRSISVETETLRRVADPLVCVPILEQYFTGNPVARPHAGVALRRLLPLLKASDSDQFSRIARTTLNTIVRKPASYSFSTEFLLICIDALGKVGDGSSAIALMGLLREKAASARDVQIYETAAGVLDILKSRLRQKRQADTLLRAADPEESHTLLHTVVIPADSLPESLLRPALTDES